MKVIRPKKISGSHVRVHRPASCRNSPTSGIIGSRVVPLKSKSRLSDGEDRPVRKCRGRELRLAIPRRGGARRGPGAALPDPAVPDVTGEDVEQWPVGDALLTGANDEGRDDHRSRATTSPAVVKRTPRSRHAAVHLSSPAPGA